MPFLQLDEHRLFHKADSKKNINNEILTSNYCHFQSVYNPVHPNPLSQTVLSAGSEKTSSIILKIQLNNSDNTDFQMLFSSLRNALKYPEHPSDVDCCKQRPAERWHHSLALSLSLSLHHHLRLETNTDGVSQRPEHKKTFSLFFIFLHFHLSLPPPPPGHQTAAARSGCPVVVREAQHRRESAEFSFFPDYFVDVFKRFPFCPSLEKLSLLRLWCRPSCRQESRRAQMDRW